MSEAAAGVSSPADGRCPGENRSPLSLAAPGGDLTPPYAAGDNDDTPASQDYTPSPPRRVDDAAEDSCQNPEPPKELADLLNADNIGGTVFSKHWLFTTLMRLLEVVERQDDSGAGKAEGTESPAVSQYIDLDDGLQDNLCKLWDMSMNPEVVSFLMEFKAVDLLSGVIAKSRAPRATEICVGILGNMACSAAACQQISDNKQLVELTLLLLETPDSPTLVETTRLLHVCLGSHAASGWVASIKQLTHVFPSILFILQSSTNHTLLRNTAEFVDKLMEIDEAVCMQWSCPELVLAIMEAIKQIGYNDSSVLETYIHLLQLVSTSEPGVQALVSYAGEVCALMMQHLVHICVDDIVAVDGRENVLCATLSILTVVLPSWSEHTSLLVTDFQLMRCISKIAEAVYPKLETRPTVALTPRRRTQSLSESFVSPSPAHSERDSDSTQSDADETNVEDETSRKKKNTLREDDHDHVVSSQQPSDVSTGSDSASTTQTPDAGSKQGVDSERSETEKFACMMVAMLFDTLQNLLAEVISILEKVPVHEPAEGLVNGKNVSEGHEHDMDGAAAVESVTEQDQTPSIIKSLVYLDQLCERRRVECLVHTLAAVSEKSLVARLRELARRNAMHRLGRIVDHVALLSSANT